MKANIELLKRLKTRFSRMRRVEHFDMEVIAKRSECGTAMCIAGHVLDLQGYKLRFAGDDTYGDFYLPSGRPLKADPLKRAAREIGIPYYEDDLGRMAAQDLFHDYSLQTPKDAAVRIQELIEEYEQ